MHRWNASRALALLIVAAGVVVGARTAGATQVWSGRTFAFAKPSGASSLLPVNQDRITPVVWITRGSIQGLFNIEVESGFTHSMSPRGTEWADGDAANHPVLTFTDWDTWATSHGGPPSTVGLNAVVHLIADDIYVDIRFDTWDAISGGGFAYHRGQPASATPADNSTWGRIKTLYR